MNIHSEKIRGIACRALAVGMIATGAGCMMIGSGCTRRIYVAVPAEKNIRDSTSRIEIRHDTVMQTDSVVMIERGDTVRREVYRTRWRVRERLDTVVRWRVDTVRESIVTPICEEKEKKNGSESFLGRIRRVAGELISLLLLVSLLGGIIRLFRRGT